VANIATAALLDDDFVTFMPAIAYSRERERERERETSVCSDLELYTSL